jgi:IS5 family transposase
MKPKKPERSDTDDLFRTRLQNIIDLKHPLVRLAHETDWSFFEAAIAPHAEHGRPGVPVRFMVGLHILKHSFDVSDEEVCDRWVENPYFQYFTGEEYFRHKLPHDRSSMTRWRGRVSETELARLLQESLRIAHKTGALRKQDMRQAIVDTTVQPKAITFPTDAKLLYRATLRLAKPARRYGVKLRQSYVRVGKLALIRSQRYAHAKQFRRHRREVSFLRTRLGRVIRDIDRKTEGNPAIEGAFRNELDLARRVRDQRRRQVGPKVYSLHAPEEECIGKGKPHKPYEFGCKVTVATTNAHAPGGVPDGVWHQALPCLTASRWYAREQRYNAPCSDTQQTGASLTNFPMIGGGLPQALGSRG